MLRKRSRAVGGSSSSKQGGMMSEPLPLNQEKFKPSSRHNHPSSPAPAAGTAFPKHFSPNPKCFSPHFDSASAMSPTSILVPSPFFSDPKTTPIPPKITPLLEPTSKGLVDALTITTDDDDDHHHHPPLNSPISSSHDAAAVRRRMVLFGSNLKIHIPSPNPPTPSPRSPPIEFGFKNKDSHLSLLSPAQRALRCGAASAKLLVANLAVSDLELSEDYTCVISHGPNPKTTHIFDNCIIESCCRRRCGGCANESGGGLLSSCHACNKRLGQGDEVFMYRGEKAFCSSECRQQEMLLDEAMD